MKGVLFKPEALDIWKEINPDKWQKIVNELIEIFVATGPTQLQQIQEACQKEDLVAIRKLAHTFKSGCANVGAESCYMIMNDIEYNASLKLPEINSRVQEFEMQFDGFLKDVAKYQKQIQAA